MERNESCLHKTNHSKAAPQQNLSLEHFGGAWMGKEGVNMTSYAKREGRISIFIEGMTFFGPY
jgi:hypothetical protein